MQKIVCRFTAVCLALVSLASNAASELQQYVQQCQNELHFSASDVKPMNCNDGPQFINGAFSLINDFLLYQKINDNVDLVAACRWGDDSIPIFNNTKFASLELIIHNRQNGETCFFAANDSITGVAYTGDPLKPIASAVASPTNFNPNHSKANPNADDYWLSPTSLNNETLISNRIKTNGSPSANDYLRCVGCHSQGSYIASADIAPTLAQFGLLNNRHDTYANMSSTSFHYHVVGSSSGAPYNNLPVMSAFQNWDATIASNNVNTDCSGACHALADNSTIGDLFVPSNLISRLLPSISGDISYLNASGIMAPQDEASDYRWINLDTPGDGIETENLLDALNATNTLVPHLFSDYSNCPQPNVPSYLEAHAVGVDVKNGFSTAEMSQLPDRLRTFNLKDGLVCINSDQESGRQCNNYLVRYLCYVQQKVPTWSDWYDTDSPTGDGDHEERSRDQNICGGVNPIGIQAQASVNGNTINVMGPNDRLARFSAYGLTCNNAAQPDGKCSNYVVRYRGCNMPPPTLSRTLTNVFAVGKQVTAASGYSTKGQAHNSTWDTQLWTIAPVTNTEYVRLKNTSNNVTVYLNVANTAEQTAVNTAAFSSTATGEMWTIETVPGSSNVRLKNLFSGLYLTIADPKNFTSTPDYLPIYSQGLNTGWTSQRWIIQ